MKLSIICFSLTGLHTAERLKTGLEEQGHQVLLAKKSKYLEDSVTESTVKWAGGRFPLDDGILFVGACGIAVRSIAPYVASKKSDPAVLVIDECGNFVISLLSGHLGGANELALQSAQILGAQPVVTTATDLHRRFAVDVFAKKNGCDIRNMTAAKEVSAALLAGKKVGFYSEFPWKGELPEGLVLCDIYGKLQEEPDEESEKSESIQKNPEQYPEIGIAVTIHKSCKPFLSTVQVIPRILTLGMGCRRDKEAEAIEKAADRCMEEADVFLQAVEQLASISLKKNEPGLLDYAEKNKILFRTWDSEALMEVQGDFTPSSFVKKITGVENVCERSAVLGASDGTLIKRKSGEDGVTTALAIRTWEVRFE